jgi:flagellar protein FliT
MKATDSEALLSTYDALSVTTGRMLAAARSGDWDRLISLERDCTSLVARLAALEAEASLPMSLREHKIALIRKLLADDAAIRDITEPYMKRLENMLGANRREQRLLGTYGPSLGG